jgi:hypothetical protein
MHGQSQQIPDYKDPSKTVEQRTRDLLQRMTAEEKFRQLFMIPGGLEHGKDKLYEGIFGFSIATSGQTSDAAGQLLSYGAAGSAGFGGNGLASSITGTSVTRGGGGGGSATGSNTGGTGGGGNGSVSGTQATNGTANLGGGGGGGYGVGGTPNGGSGGSGVVIISAPQAATSTTGSPTVTTSGGLTIYTFTASGTITF